MGLLLESWEIQSKNKSRSLVTGYKRDPGNEVVEPPEFFRSLLETIVSIGQITARITSLLCLKVFMLVTLQNEGSSTGVVHGLAPQG